MMPTVPWEGRSAQSADRMDERWGVEPSAREPGARLHAVRRAVVAAVEAGQAVEDIVHRGAPTDSRAADETE